MITPSQFKIKFPFFATTLDATIQISIDESAISVTERWGKYEDMGLYYLTAHLLTLSTNLLTGDNSSMQTVAGQSVGSVSVSYANPALNNTSDAFFGSTAYGQQYLIYKSKARQGFATIC